jgi:DNA-binding NarL/FixJ family response regulator
MIDTISRPAVAVMIVDGNAVTRAGLRALLSAQARLAVVAEATDAPSALRLAERTRPEVVLLDTHRPHPNDLDVLRRLATLSRVLVTTRDLGPGAVEEAMRAGASGFLVHGDFTPYELTRALLLAGPDAAHLSPRAATALLRGLRLTRPTGSAPRTREADTLTPREREIMDLIAQGLSNARIAGRLVLSEKTVKNHINHILGKLHAQNRAEAMASWLGTATRTPVVDMPRTVSRASLRPGHYLSSVGPAAHPDTPGG